MKLRTSKLQCPSSVQVESAPKQPEMNEATKNPFEPLFDEIRRIVREELKAATNAKNSNGHSPSLLSAAEAAKLWDVPKTWISEAARRGELPSVRLGHYVRFQPEDLEEFIKRNRTGCNLLIRGV